MKRRELWFITLFAVIFAACGRQPKALDYGYFRIDLPEAKYHAFDGNLPYTFELSDYAKVTPIDEEPYWLNIDYQDWNATVHCSYKSLKTNNLNKAIEDARTLVYKHTIRADAISEEYFENAAERTFGVLYNIEGNAASSLQFFMTDSVNHFVRGSLYFNNVPNADSIAPVNAFIAEDVRHLMETLRWKSTK